MAAAGQQSTASSAHDPVRQEDIPLPTARSTGLVFAAVAVIIAVWWRAEAIVWLPAVLAAISFAGLAMFASSVLEPLNLLWFRFALLLNLIVSPVVMFVLYVTTIVPMGLAMQLVRDPLLKRPQRAADEADSYWIDVRAEHARRDMRDQF